jgi:soluble lytic murein transglycosylase
LAAALIVAVLPLQAPAQAQISDGSKAVYRARLADNAAGRFDRVSGSPVAASAAVPILDAVVTWDRLRRESADADFGEISKFMLANPTFPQGVQLRRLAEKALDETVPPADVTAFFERFAPLSAAAKLQLAQAQLAQGQRAAAIATARDAWDSAGLDETEEGALLRAFGSELRDADHLGRAERLLWSGQITAAGRLLPRLDMDRRLWLLARIALYGRQSGAQARLAAVPDALRADPGLVRDEAVWLRRQGQTGEANAVFIRSRPEKGAVFDKREWLATRLEFGRAAWRAGDPASAYAILAGHGSYAPGTDLAAQPLGERVQFVELEWLAGWLALRKLDRATDAAVHFRALTAASQTPLSQSKGNYWTGRALEAAGDAAGAKAAYTEAAQHPDYFYGQLAHEKLGRAISVKTAPDLALSADRFDTFRAEPLVRALEAVTSLEDRDLQSVFMRQLVARAETAEDHALVAAMGTRIGRRDLGVMAGKSLRGMGEAAGPYAAGIPLYEAAWPVLDLPGSLAGARVMIHAIARQESLFDQTARSRADARGLMQLLPSTAAEQARKLGLSASTARLTTDPVYNVQLGSAYFSRLRDSFGSTVLAVAGYNAGPGNARKFIARNGDPREAGTDVIDWIEAIPFSETRSYVQRVLENAVVYEAQFGGTPVPSKRLGGSISD